jgi:hypothetical protein
MPRIFPALRPALHHVSSSQLPQFPITCQVYTLHRHTNNRKPPMLNHPRRGLPRITDGIERHPDAYLLDTAANLHHLIAEKQHLISTSNSSPKSNFKLRQSRMENIHHTTRENSHTLYYLPIQPLEASRTRLSKGGQM